MKKLLLYGLLLVLLGILAWWFYETYLGLDSGNTKTTISDTSLAGADDQCHAPLQISDGANFSSESDQNVRFLRSEFKNLSISARTENALKETARYVAKNGDRFLLITGRYAKDENYTGILPNLGMARAKMIKNILTGFAAPANQIEVQGINDGATCFIKDTLSNGLRFSFTDTNNNASRLARIKARLLDQAVILHFTKDSDRIDLTTQQRQDFADLSFYLDHVPNTGLAVNGYTDNQGTAEDNLQLSQNWAQNVRAYIVRNAGINSNRLSTRGLGNTKPIASNDTAEGRAKNRRVEIILLEE